MGWRVFAWGVGSLALLGCGSGSFICAQDSQCQSDGVEGTCEPSGFCSFPDETCPSGRRFGEAAGGNAAGLCVDEEPGSTGASSSATVDPSSSGTSTTEATSTTNAPPTMTTSSTGPSTTAVDSGSSGLDSSTGSECPLGSEGCPCRDDLGCEGYFICDGEVCVDPLPDCGNGSLNGGEECDDENRIDEDGCSAQCLFETMCIVTHEGGDPAEVRSWRVERDGGLSQVDNAVLGGEHAPAYSRAREQGLVRCGRRVYGILDEGDAVFGFDVGSNGELSPIQGLPTVVNPLAVLCDEDANVLFTFAGTTTIEVRSWSLGGTGQLTELDDTTVIFPFVPAYASFLMHPEGGQFYVVAGEESFGGNEAPLHVNRTRYEDDGSLSIEQAAVPQGGSAFFLGASIDRAGEYLFISGYSGTIFARTPLGPDGAVADDLTNAYFPKGGAANRVLAVSGDYVIVSRGSSKSAMVSIARFTPPPMTVDADASAPSVACTMRLLYGEEVLVAGCSYEGGMSTYLLEGNEPVLTRVSTNLTMPDNTFQSLAAVACRE